MKKKLIIFWNRSDSRLLDNPALYYACKRAEELGCQMTTLFILDPEFYKNPTCSRRMNFLVKILRDLNKVIKLSIIEGDPIEVIKELLKIYELEIFANADFEPFAKSRDKRILELTSNNDFAFNLLNDKISIDKSQISKSNTIYSVFTPFKKAVIEDFLNAKTLQKPNLEKIDQIRVFPEFNFDSFVKKIPKLSINILGFKYDLEKQDQELVYDWYTNEEKVLNEFKGFLVKGYDTYSNDRNTLTVRNSMMSVALKWGLVSSRTLKEMILTRDLNPLESSYVSELIWREFYKYVLYNHQQVLDTEFLLKYRNKESLWFSQDKQKEYFLAWIEGRTGYSIVDAGIHQLRQEGYMHNRSRMIVSSILTKNLGCNWRLGQEYFRAMLLDLDEASNNGGWQWSSSVGVDPKPLRIFNPHIQQEKFDPDNIYHKKYLPDNYNLTPIIEHTLARDFAITRYKTSSAVDNI